MSVPDVRAYDYLGPSTWSTATHQYAAVPGQDNSLRVGKRDRSDGSWTTHTFAGANATSMGLPMIEDDHCYVAIAVDDDGFIWVCGNMHSQLSGALYILRSTNPDDITAWTDPMSTPPGGTFLLHGWSYPQFIKFTDGALFWTMRDGSNEEANTRMWRMDAGANTASHTWTSLGTLFQGISSGVDSGDGNDEWGVYVLQFFIEDANSANPNRLHVAMIWSATGGNQDEQRLMYVRSDDRGDTWENIDGTSITLPILPDNTTARLNASDAGWPQADTGLFVHVGTLVVDPATGNPYFTMSGRGGGENRLIWHDGADWQFETCSPGGGGTFPGHVMCVWHKGQLWFMTRNALNASKQSRIHLWARDTEDHVMLGPDVMSGADINLHWDTPSGESPTVCIDREAQTLFGSIELSLPDNLIPRTYSYGRGARVRTA